MIRNNQRQQQITTTKSVTILIVDGLVLKEGKQCFPVSIKQR